MEKRLRGDRTGQISPTALRSDRRRGWCSQTHADTTEPCAAAWARAAEGSRQFDPTQRCGMRDAGSREQERAVDLALERSFRDARLPPRGSTRGPHPPPTGLAHLPGSWHTCLVPGTVVPACSQQCCRCHADFKNAGSKCSTGFDLESGMSAPVSKGGRAHGRVDWVAKVIDGNDGRDHPEPTGGWLMGQDFMTDD